MTLGVAISGYKEIIDRGYDFKALSEAADFLSVMSFDFHGAWEGQTGHISPLHGVEGEKFPNYNTVSKQFSFYLKLLIDRIFLKILV